MPLHLSAPMYYAKSVNYGAFNYFFFSQHSSVKSPKGRLNLADYKKSREKLKTWKIQLILQQ